MNKKIYLIGIVVALIFSACTKTTIIEETIIEEGEGPVAVDYYGVWKQQNDDPTDKSLKYYSFEKGSAYCAVLEEDENGLRDKDYRTVVVTATSFRVAGEQNRPYKISGDTLTFLGGWNGPHERTVMVKVTDGSVDAANWVIDLKVLRTTLIPEYINSTNTNYSFGIEGDFLYVNQYYNAWKFYKLNTLNGTFVDSVNAPINSGNYSLHFKGSSNKLYHTRTNTSNMEQRVGLNGASSNLSSNTLSNIQAISTNASSGTVYSFGNNILYSGSEGGSFSSLYTFTGSNIPNSIVYYKSDQFIGLYNSTLILFEISPTYKIIKQYQLPGSPYLYQSLATNGSDVWLMTYDNQLNRYQYQKVSLD